MHTEQSSLPAWVVWALCVSAGTALIALPDTGPRVVSLSTTHGPGVVDLLGAAILTAGWVVLDVHTWRRRARLRRRVRPKVAAAAAASVAAAGGLLVWSVATDTGSWWLAGAAVLGAAQVAAATVCSRRDVAPLPSEVS